MAEQREVAHSDRERWFRKVQVNCSQRLGVSLGRRRQVYQELIETVSLRDVSYWLEIFFAAGIATLGLVMNSVAVIIGAMLISPLMGVILANGLAFAAGDFILAVRASLNLALSCALSIGFAVLLVACLPFKDMTPEIMARTEPSLLDLGIAVFSGILATVMTAKRHSGPMNSIPGVAIAVALMPPLCVIGYGIGLAISVSWKTGMDIALGGGLLFLTNLTAITLMAMVVFTLLRIDNFGLREEVEQWHKADPESRWLFQSLKRFQGLNRLRISGSLVSRFVVLSLPIFLLLTPLSQSFARLSQTIVLKQRENKITQTSRALWQEHMTQDNQDNIRSHIDQIAVNETGQQLVVQMTVFTSRSYSQEEKQQYKNLLSTALKRDPETIQLRLLEIPTASYELLQVKRQETTTIETPTVKTISEYQTAFLTAIDAAMRSFQLPEPKQLLDYHLALQPNQPLSVTIIYLAETQITADARSLLKMNIRERLNQADTNVQLQWINAVPEPIQFDANGDEVNTAAIQRLGAIAKLLQQYPDMYLEVAVSPTNSEPEGLSRDRFRAIAQIMQKRWAIGTTRVRPSPQQRTLDRSSTRPSKPQAELRLQYDRQLDPNPVPPSTLPPLPSTPSDQ